MKYTFLGLGLIGGSIAKALRKADIECYIESYDTNEYNINLALEEGIINKKMMDIFDFDRTSDIIFLCSPIDYNLSNLRSIAPYVLDDTIITDVGSVKSSIHELYNSIECKGTFIGGHPMTGSEKSGFEHADNKILENAYYILTPSDDASNESIEKLEDIVKSMNALPIISDCKKHDYSTAAISHVPHLIAASLVELVEENDFPDGFMKIICAGGFKDITRIASSSPIMWENICRNNSYNINVLLTKYIDYLTNVKSVIDNEHFDEINKLFDKAGEYRNSINEHAKGSILNNYRLNLNINDEAGAIAAVATKLAIHQISIKNIGITHNREHEEGILYIIFYNEDSLNEAKNLFPDNIVH